MKAIEYLVKLMRSQEGEWKVNDLMTKDVVTIEPEATVHDAVEKMRSHGIHGIIVAKKGNLVGVMSGYDVLLLMARGEHGKNVRVEEIMTTELITANPEDDIIDALELMLTNHIMRLPVLDNCKLVGIITTTDFVNAFDEGFQGESPGKEKIVTELLVRNIMHKPVIMIEPDKSVFEAAKLMTKNNIGSLVINEECKVGIITESDIFKRVIARGKDSKKTKVADVMTTPCKTVGPNADMFEASRIFHDNDIRRLPVVENCEVIGIVAVEDIIDVISLRRRF